MTFSTLTEISESRDIVESFKGYNHNLRIADGEFYDMKNLTSAFYPVMSPRGKRGVYAYPSSGTHSPHGLIAKDALCYVDGTTLYINNYAISGLTLTDSAKQLISMGSYIIIMPDKKYINTLDYTDKGDIEASFNSAESSIQVTYSMCNADGTDYSNVTVSSSEPQSPENMALWIDTSSTPHTLKQYSSSSATWVQIATTYIKIAYANIASAFAQYDAVKITGLPTDITQLADLEGQTSPLWAVYHDPGDTSASRAEGTNDYVVVVGILDAVATKTSQLCLQRLMPNLDFITESENRLWGCRYGTDIDGNVVNEIYACKLGDFKNWNCFMGLSTDSYTASCGTDGAWTGAITHLGYPLFFKENCLHKVYGNYPSNYQIQTTACRGVMKGAGNSLAIVNEKLFYKSRSGVCVYDGSLPSEVSSDLGDVHYTALDTTTGYDPLRCGAVGGSHHNKYYISMKSEEDNEWYLFVYDDSLSMWHKEDNTRADAFCSCRDEMYYIDHATGKIKTILGSGTAETSEVEWLGTTGLIGTSSPDKKYVSKLTVRMSLGIGSRVTFEVEYDSCGQWEHLASLVGSSLRTFSVPIRTRRSDHLRLRITGYGDCKIYSIVKTLTEGSDD